MNPRVSGTFSKALLSLGLILSARSFAQNPGNGAGEVPVSPADAAQMVGARAALEQTLDSKKVEVGQAFKARLPEKVRLTDGQELPRGTTLVGKVAEDAEDVSGMLTLSLQIDQAQLKGGKTIPLKAMIVGVFPAGNDVATQARAVAPGEQAPNPWRPGMDNVDQIGALRGVDLHSRINGDSSGELVSNRKDNIQLKAGTELALAIAPAASIPQTQHAEPER